MSIIKASCVDQTLRLTNTPVIASGGVGEDFVEFSFCSQWDGYMKTAVFYNERGVFYAILDTDNTCVIPAQALEVAGNLFISVFGYKDGVTRTSEVLQYQIVEGAITAVDDPDPDVYEQILAEIAAFRAEWEEKYNEMVGLQEDIKTLQEDVAALQEDTAAKLITISLPAAAWVEGVGFFTQEVTVEGGTEHSLIALQPTPGQILVLQEDGVSALQVNNDGGTFTAAATGSAPSVDMTIQATILEVST